MDPIEKILFTIIFGGAALGGVLIVVFIALKVAGL
jgi:hypothetical protein